MWNKCKTLLRDHSVPEVTLKACPRHYSVSAIPETLTVREPKRPPNPHPTIQYKKSSLNPIADSLSRLRTGDHYKYDVLLHNAEPLVLKEKVEINMVTTCAKSAEQDQSTPKLPDLQIKVWDIFKTLDK